MSFALPHLSFPVPSPSENGGLHDNYVCTVHAGQMPLPVLRPASHGRGPCGTHTPAASATTTSHPGEDLRPGPQPAGASPG